MSITDRSKFSIESGSSFSDSCSVALRAVVCSSLSVGDLHDEVHSAKGNAGTTRIRGHEPIFCFQFDWFFMLIVGWLFCSVLSNFLPLK